MTIEFNCPNCQKLLRTGDDKAGVTAKCPDCKTPITVPQPGEEFGIEEEDDFGYEEDYAEDDYEEEYAAAPPRAAGMKPCPMCGEKIKAAAVKCRYCGEDLSGGGRRPGRARRMDYAGFWLRFAAYFIDAILLNVVSLILSCVIGFIFGAMIAGGGGQVNEGAVLVIQIITSALGFLFVWLYFALMESSSNQATLGKMAVGIKVTDMNGRRITFGQASGRFFGKLLSGMICLAGYIMAGFTEKKQALHDMLAGCLVVRK